MDDSAMIETKHVLLRNGSNTHNGQLTKDKRLSSGARQRNGDAPVKYSKHRQQDFNDVTNGCASGVGQPNDIGKGQPNDIGKGQPNESNLFLVINAVILPIFVLTVVPNFIMATIYANTECGGSLSEMLSRFQDRPFSSILANIWGKNLSGIGFFTFAVVFGYFIWATFCSKMIPGKPVQGPMTPMGSTPVYLDNGLYCYLLTMVMFCLSTIILKLNGQTPTIVLDHFGELATFMNIFSYIFVFMLYLKGIYSASTTDSGKTGKGFIFDYYWGTELYPRVFGIDIKVLTNCRFAMTLWPLLVCMCALKSYELNGFVDSMIVTTILQLFYLTKFFYWEAGYYGTMDIVQDRAGFYIIWGVLSLLPPLYPIASFYLVKHPVHLGPFWTSIILFAGIFSTTINYLADRQKHVVRRTNGNCRIWGKRPDIIRAKYRTGNGKVGESILLASGWWGISRHFHYVPEILLTFCWTVTAGFENVLPYSYLIFLVVLLVHRSFRDERKCSQKYGEYWKQYCLKVKYRILPYIF